MGITRSSRHKRAATGAQRAYYRKKRRFEGARPPAMTKLGPKRVHEVRTRGGNVKHRALRLEVGNFAWATEHVLRKTRIIDVVYNASNNELVRTNTLVKGSIVQIDAHPFRQWFEAHYATPVTKKVTKASAAAAAAAATAATDADGTKEPKKRSTTREKIFEERKKEAIIDPALELQFGSGRLYAMISSRPGQAGRADGYVLEGRELEFYIRRIRAGKKHAA